MQDSGRGHTIGSVWMVSREYDGLAGAGGVKDVCRQLAEALARDGGCRVRVILPRYGFMDAAALGFTPLELPSRRTDGPCAERRRRAFAVEMNYTDRERREDVSIWERREEGLTIFLVEAERFAEKLGVYTYTAAEEEKTPWQRQGSGHYDYFAMNILLQKAALDLMLLLDEAPDVIHCQDGHAATLAAMARENSGYRHFFSETGLVVTIHNAGLGYHQEVGDLAFARAVTGLPQSVVRRSRLGPAFDPFVAAAGYACINTVSEQYARELQETREDARTGWLGHRLLQRGVRIIGITNGINPADIDPTRPGQLGLAAAFDPLRGDLAGKRRCKEDMLSLLAGRGGVSGVEQFGTLSRDADLPLFTFIGRLTAQKGVDVLLPALAGLAGEDRGFQALILGSGDPDLEKALAAMTGQDEISGRCCFLKGYHPGLANRIYAAGDFFLIPSRYEPCGLTDYMAQLLGNLPIVHHVGGLVKVLDGRTGFSYRKHTPEALARAMRRALALFRDDPAGIRTMQRQAVEEILEHHTWDKVMASYLALYRDAQAMACAPVNVHQSSGE